MVFCDFFGVAEVFGVGNDGFFGVRRVFRNAGDLFGIAEVFRVGDDGFFGVAAEVSLRSLRVSARAREELLPRRPHLRRSRVRGFRTLLLEVAPTQRLLVPAVSRRDTCGRGRDAGVG